MTATPFSTAVVAIKESKTLIVKTIASREQVFLTITTDRRQSRPINGRTGYSVLYSGPMVWLSSSFSSFETLMSFSLCDLVREMSMFAD